MDPNPIALTESEVKKIYKNLTPVFASGSFDAKSVAKDCGSES